MSLLATQRLRPDGSCGMARFDDLLSCWLSGQISAAQWESHKTDELFCAWLKKRGLS